MSLTLPIIFFCVLLNTAAQILLKEAMNHLGEISLAWATLWPTAWRVGTNPFLMVGLVLYVFSLVFWLVVLYRIPVGVAYPLSSLGYITTAVAATYFLGENFSVSRMIGILIIIAGVYLVTQGGFS